MFDAKAPRNTMRNVRCDSAARAVPGAPRGLSPSTTGVLDLLDGVVLDPVLIARTVAGSAGRLERHDANARGASEDLVESDAVRATVGRSLPRPFGRLSSG